MELQEYYKLNSSAKVTGIDLSQGMLTELQRKFVGKNITLILDSYFDVPLGENVFDAAVSVESLHHFTKEEKIPLYLALLREVYKEERGTKNDMTTRILDFRRTQKVSS